MFVPFLARAEANDCQFDCLEAVQLRDRAGALCDGSGGYVYVRSQHHAPSTTFSTAAACRDSSTGCVQSCRTLCSGGEISPTAERTHFPGVGGSPACILGTPHADSRGIPMYTVAQACPRGTESTGIQAVTMVGPWNAPQCNESAGGSPAPTIGGTCTDPIPPAGAQTGSCQFYCMEVDNTHPVGVRTEGGSCDNVTIRPHTEGNCTIGQTCACPQTCERVCGQDEGLHKSRCFTGTADAQHLSPCPGQVGTASSPRCSALAPAGASTAAGSPVTLTNPLGTNDLGVLISRFIRALSGVAGALALLMFVAGGIIWMTAESSERVSLAKTIMQNSTIGLLLIFFSYAIVNIFLSLFGV